MCIKYPHYEHDATKFDGEVNIDYGFDCYATPHEYQFGSQGDISNLCNYDWYDWCYYREEGTNAFPFSKEILGHVLGPSKNEGNEMAQSILTHKGTVVPQRSVRRLTDSKLV